jgi:hypothetical protein
MEDQKDFAVASVLPKENIALVNIDSDETLQDKITTLSQDPNIEYVQPNYIYQIFSNTPNDPYFSYQRSLSNVGQDVAGIS